VSSVSIGFPCEVTSGFLDDPKKLQWQPMMRHEMYEKQLEEAAARTFLGSLALGLRRLRI
jgi:hypothetical protein